MNLEDRLKYAEMKARHENALRPWYKKWWGIIILAIISLTIIFLIASALYVTNKVKEINNGPSAEPNPAEVQTYLQKVNGDGTNYFLGTSTPQVTIIEFGDFSCTHCKDSYPVVNQLAQTYKDKIKIVWRDYLINDGSIDLALAARCAGEQGQFWQMHDILFDNQDALIINNSERLGKLVALAQQLKLNAEQFSTCLSGQKYLIQIKKDYDDANGLNISGTPTWFVNNYSFSGYVPLDKFTSLISGLIK